MPNHIYINKKISPYSKIIQVGSDKSLSIRTILLASQAVGVSKISNLLESEDVINALKSIKKLGINFKKKKNFYEIYGFGLNGFKPKNNTIINAGNSGTLGRLILSLLIKTEKKIKLIGDKSLSKRDFKRISDPLTKFGAKFKLKNKKNLPLTIKGTSNLTPIKYLENRGSAQCKSSVIFAAMRTNGTTQIKAKKSRNHTELLCKYLKLPIIVKSKKNYDEINVKKVKLIKPLNYNIPSDISSSAFFIVLTALSNRSELIIKNVNINPSRTGIITILKKMGVKIMMNNIRTYKGEKISDVKVKSSKIIKSINCPPKLNSGAIDEFLIIFLVAAKANGISKFTKLSELNQKESPRLKWGEYILNQMGIKTISTNDSIKIFGNPKLKVEKNIIIKNYLKDHRVFMTSVIAALSFGGEWKVHDKDSIKTSFPSFLKIVNELKN